MSRASPVRPSGMIFSICSFISAVIVAVMSVSMKPGATTLTVMLREAYSRAIDLAAPMRAALVAA